MPKETDLKEKVTLSNIGEGALVEMFDNCFKEVLTNVKDINTDAKKPRTITLKIEVYPDATRSTATYRLHANTKLQSLKPKENTFHIRKDGANFNAFESDPEQEVMDFNKLSEIAKNK